MNPKSLLFLALSLAGILILLFISQHLPAKKLKITNITEKDLNQEIEIHAKIIDIKDFRKKSFQILTLKDETGNITGITSSKIPLEINKTRNLTYTITGRVQEYNRTLQINIDKIILE